VTEPTEEPTFDPYRYGAPEHPVPPEFAPPGYQVAGYQPAKYAQPRQGAAPDARNPDIQNPYAPNPYAASPYPPNPSPPNPYSQQPYGPQPPGYPPGYPVPPAYQQYAQPRPGSGKAVAGLVLGILAALLCWMSIFDLILIVPALIFSLLGLSDARKGSGGRGMAMAGLILVALGTVGAIVLTVVYVRFGRSIDCGVYHAPGTLSASYCDQRNN
jgi:hypothetical protein